MRKSILISLIGLLFVAGCDNLRFAPNETQKQNAYLHNRTSMLAAEMAEDEGTSNKLQAVTKLSELQSRAFLSYSGLPKEFPPAETADDVLSEASYDIAAGAISDSSDRPDAWELADAGMELGIGICALFGGVFGAKAASYLKKAKAKSQALKEIVENNELFKKLNTEIIPAFKQAQNSQSAETKQIVAEIKS